MRTFKELKELLKVMVKAGASDLHIRAGSKPILRVNTKLRVATNFDKVTPEDGRKLVEDICSDKELKEYQKNNEVDMSLSVGGLARFRVNIFQQRNTVDIVMRLVPTESPSIDEIMLPESIKKIASQQRGIVLVTGTTGSGKSTTLAAMINYINRNLSKHIITLEDPIEYLHNDIKSIVSQREIGVDTFSYPGALKHIVRQDPDVILIGEMRDTETMKAALTAAQMGHLVLSTIHTINAVQTVTRIVDIFPPHHQNQIRLQLADSITAVISQRLLPKKDGGGMVPAVEVMIATSLIRKLIEENDYTAINEQIEKGDYYGMQSFNQSLEKLYKAEHIDLDEAKKAATNPEDLMLRIRGIKSSSGAEA
ncbi:MAG: type IV pilus twitching motility protein PilT [Elusimicrobia bacterium]|jgi:twitching motility protein PilT|nr:type IV pilus twitching motility protein PilT [Elusimicrobiota bacterium]